MPDARQKQNRYGAVSNFSVGAVAVFIIWPCCFG